jgi:hypothetical protein
MQHSSYLLCGTPLSSTFIHSIVSFNFSLLQVFGCFLGPGSFHSLEGLLAHKHVFIPINFDGIEFILIITIAPTTYLENWAFVA